MREVGRINIRTWPENFAESTKTSFVVIERPSSFPDNIQAST
jgi:hypothetical protein